MSTLDGFDVDRLLLERLKHRIGSRDDQPTMRAELEDGMVVRWRAVSAAELLDELIAECRGTVE